MNKPAGRKRTLAAASLALLAAAAGGCAANDRAPPGALVRDVQAPLRDQARPSKACRARPHGEAGRPRHQHHRSRPRSGPRGDANG